MTKYEEKFWIDFYEKQGGVIKKERYTKKLTRVIYVLVGLVAVLALFELKVL